MTFPLRLWILFCSLCVAAGWGLSLANSLDRTGYLAVFGLAVAVLVYWGVRRQGQGIAPFASLKKLARRFRRHPLPFCFLVLVVMAFIGGALYEPDNSDTSDYRIPRVWHWLAAGHWHWIHSLDLRLNNAGTGYEWLTSPLMLFTRTDRWIFIFNWISYLFLPGLVFSVFTRLGVRPRVAWWWMWILPAGWCYAMQASSVVNDSFAAIYVLAAVDGGLRARQTGRISDAWLGCLCLGLMTGSKQTNLPLLLPCALPLLAVIPVLLRRPLATGAVLLLTAVVSFIPTTLLNLRYTGDWMGFTKSLVDSKMNWAACAVDSPFWGVVGNLFCLPLANLHPPFVPGYDKWNAAMQHFLTTGLGSHFKTFEFFGHLDKSAIEANAGLGPLLTLFILLTALVAWSWRRNYPAAPVNYWRLVLLLSPWVALLAFMAKVGSSQIGRHASPYYLLLIPLILTLPANSALTRRTWWRSLVWLQMIFTVLVLAISRERPVLPIYSALGALERSHPQWHWAGKIRQSFAIRVGMEEGKGWVTSSLPPEDKLVGFACVRGSLEPGMWLPFGSREVYRILPDETPAALRAMGIRHIIADQHGLERFGLTPEQWMEQMQVRETAFHDVAIGPGVTNRLYLLELADAPPADKKGGKE